MKWISVDDSMPLVAGRYLILKENGHISIKAYYNHFGKYFFAHTKATHWQPLPEPPR